MIDRQATRESATRRLWSGTVQRLFQTLDLSERETATDVSESLAVFCEQHPYMLGHTLSLLMARSFCVAGDRDAAGRVLLYDRAHRTHADSWLEVLSVEYPFPELYPLFSSRALRPLRLKTVGEQTIWVLDLNRIHLAEADRHEMILLQTLRTLAETASNVWNLTDGQGTLVVNGLSRFSNSSSSSRRKNVSQTLDYLQEVFQRRAALNGWSFVPSVLLLDL